MLDASPELAALIRKTKSYRWIRVQGDGWDGFWRVIADADGLVFRRRYGRNTRSISWREVLKQTGAK